LSSSRFADDLVILIDAHPRHDWLIGAVEKRLREELVELQVEIWNMNATARRTAKEAKRRLEAKIKIMLKRESVTLVLTPITPLEAHQCSALRPVEK
jgi:hypothetical protein